MGSVIELDAAHLAASGAVTPAVTISNVASPNALAFDAKGDLWVGDVARLLPGTGGAADVLVAPLTAPGSPGPRRAPFG